MEVDCSSWNPFQLKTALKKTKQSWKKVYINGNLYRNPVLKPTGRYLEDLPKSS